MKRNSDYRNLLRNMAVEWVYIFYYVKKYKIALFLYILLGLVATAMSLGGSVAAKHLIDAVINKSNDTILFLAVLTVGLAVFQQVFQAISSYITSVVSSRISNEIREDIYTKILNAQWEEISSYHSGDILNRLETDVKVVSNAVIGFIPNAITRLAQFFGALIIVLYYDKTMALIALMSAPFLFFSSKILVKTIRKYSQKSREINGEILSYSEESAQNLLTIKAFGLTKDYIDKFKLVLEDYRDTKLAYDKFSILMTMILSLIGLVVSYCCYGWGVYRLWQGMITFGTMTLFIQLSGMLTSSFNSLASLVPMAVSTATSAGRIMEITELPKELDVDSEKVNEILEKAKDSGVSINFDNVTFKYKDAENNVIEKTTFKINPGETVALVGPSGEGKTTILKLLLGIMPVTDGEIIIETPEGEKVLVSNSTRRFYSYVPQTTDIFSGTIRENLIAVKPDATDDELQEVIRLSSLEKLVSSLPKGIETIVNEQGGNFSQGQLQRIAIARALLKDSMILLMDEATSALDAETEKAVLQGIMKSNPSKICIITTHRESMLKHCDRVFTVESDGGIIEITC
ncbi:MAG: ABC transporter ATP-binding protein [Clostridia bacterium]|nr:ABC transporter ATP-binding protein [Clostridia bacterium]